MESLSYLRFSLVFLNIIVFVCLHDVYMRFFLCCTMHMSKLWNNFVESYLFSCLSMNGCSILGMEAGHQACCQNCLHLLSVSQLIISLMTCLFACTFNFSTDSVRLIFLVSIFAFLLTRLNAGM